MTTELGLSPKEYSGATTTFLVGYVIFQLPGTLLIKKIGAPTQFFVAMAMVKTSLVAFSMPSYY